MKKITTNRVEELYHELESAQHKLRAEIRTRDDFITYIDEYIGVNGKIFNILEFIRLLINTNYRRSTVNLINEYIRVLIRCDKDVDIAEENMVNIKRKLNKLGLPVNGDVLTAQSMVNTIISVNKNIKQ